MTLEDKMRISFLIGAIRGTRRSMTDYYRKVKKTEPITGKILEKCIGELGSAERRMCNLISAATGETVSDDETPVSRSVKDEDDGKEK